MTLHGSPHGTSSRVRGSPRAAGLRVACVAVVLLALPLVAREAVAQRSATIQASATVMAGYAATSFRADTAAASEQAPGVDNVQRVALPGAGVLEVWGAPGAEIRVAPRPQAGAATARVSIEYAGN